MLRYIPSIEGDVYKINDDPTAIVFFRADDDTFYICSLYLDNPDEDALEYIRLNEDIYYTLLASNDDYIQLYVASVDEMIATINAIDRKIYMDNMTLADVLKYKK